MRVSVFSVFKSVFFTILIVVVCVGGYAVYQRLPELLDEFAKPPKAARIPAGVEVIVNIPKGASLSQVGKILEKEGVITSPLVFKLVAMIRGEQRKIQAGEYALKTGSDSGEVLDQLISGKTLMFSFMVPEGYDIFQTAEIFERAALMSRDEFLQLVRSKDLLAEFGIKGDSLEGYLFPDTYFLRKSERQDGVKVVRRMVSRFFDVYNKHVRKAAEAQGMSMHKVVTLASLIEKEARASEHALVSSVFHNRLRNGVLLQSDPTVIYRIKPMGAAITVSDLKRDHPYNTYVRRGLPPGPIANPGKASLIAAVNPADTDYFYFVAKNDGTHQFSKTLREHNHWVNLYQRQARNKKR